MVDVTRKVGINFTVRASLKSFITVFLNDLIIVTMFGNFYNYTLGYVFWIFTLPKLLIYCYTIVEIETIFVKMLWENCAIDIRTRHSISLSQK